MGYALDPERIPLDAYLRLLKRQTLLPSRRLLLDDADARFARMRTLGVETVARLLSALASPVKIEAFARQSGIPAQYLRVLRREAGTLRQKPVPLAAFPGTDPTEIEALARQGVKTSRDYWESRPAGGDLYALCDLARINGVGPSAARMFREAGCRSARDIARADVPDLLARVAAVNADKRYYRGTLGEKDIRFCVDYARVLEEFG